MDMQVSCVCLVIFSFFDNCSCGMVLVDVCSQISKMLCELIVFKDIGISFEVVGDWGVMDSNVVNFFCNIYFNDVSNVWVIVKGWCMGV